MTASGSQAGYDGVFRAPPLEGRTVNVKTYSRNEWVLDIGKHPCDYYLVLTGPPGQARVRPWVIESIYLFDSCRLIRQLRQLGIKVGVATSVRKQYWQASRIFPAWQGSSLDLNDDQIAALRLFSA